ncbi:MAG TPA: signal peptidase I [Acidimicrobiia bacterium]
MRPHQGATRLNPEPRGRHIEGYQPDPVGETRPEPPSRSKKTKKNRSFWAELPGLLLTALVIAVLIKTFLVQPFWIPSESMLDTIHVNDRVMVNKLAYQLGEPERGDVVVFRDPGEPEIEESIPEAVIRSVLEAVGIRTRGRDDLIKRVVGLPGETITISENQVHVNGVAISEPYLEDDVIMPDAGPFEMGDDEVFVMGDNREFSFDSRRFGNIELDALVGRAFVIIWPPSNFDGL